MYAQQQQPRKAPGTAPTGPAFQTQNEAAAREKLATYVYEYLVLNGANKSAEAFKSEMLQNQNNVKVNQNDTPGFLLNWWFVFWDLYCAAPERRETCESSQEAKAFHEFGFIPPSYTPHPGTMMNGMHGGPPQFPPNAAPSPLGMPASHEGMMPPGHPGGNFSAGPPRYTHPGAPGGPRNPNPGQMGPGFGGPGGPPHMFPGGDQMRGMPPQRMPNAQPPPGPNPAAMRMAPNFARPNGPPMRYAAQMYMDNQSGTPFPPGSMMQNGAICSNAQQMMSSPGPSGPMAGGPDANDPRNFLMMTAPSSLPYGMGSEGPSIVSQAGSMNVPGVSSAGPQHDGPAGKISGLINGEAEMKQSPASNLNGGTPAPGGGGPGSQCGPPSVHGGHGPGSVHSQGGGPVSVAGGQQHQQHPQEEQSEISKIKASIMEDVINFGGKEENGSYGAYGGMS